MSIGGRHEFTKWDYNSVLYDSKATQAFKNREAEHVNHYLLDDRKPDVVAAHAVSARDFPGPEFNRAESHMAFGARSDPDHFLIRIFCGCPKRDGAKALLSCYAGQKRGKGDGYCSMCSVRCTGQRYYWRCPNCFEHMCTDCHGAIDSKVKKRQEVLLTRVNKNAAPNHWIYDREHWQSLAELEKNPWFKRRCDVTWHAQIALHGDENDDAGAQYAYNDKRFLL